MDPITMIISALVAGAVAAGKDVGGKAVRDAYAGFKALISKKISGRPQAEKALAKAERKPEETLARAEAERELKAVNADADGEIVNAARSLIELLREHDFELTVSPKTSEPVSPFGGIHAKRIRAKKVIKGASFLNVDRETSETLAEIAADMDFGGIHSDDLESEIIVEGIHSEADVQNITPEDLQNRIARLSQSVRKALEAGEITDPGDAEYLEESLRKTEKELVRETPRGSIIIRSLENATDILNKTAETLKAAGNVQAQAIRLAPAATAAYLAAKALFGV